MPGLEAKPLAQGLSFGARIAGLTRASLTDAAIRRQLAGPYEIHGVLVFEEVEQSGRMLVELAAVFGPLREHAMSQAITLAEEEEEAPVGVLELSFQPEDGDTFEVDGKVLSGWLPLRRLLRQGALPRRPAAGRADSARRRPHRLCRRHPALPGDRSRAARPVRGARHRLRSRADVHEPALRPAGGLPGDPAEPGVAGRARCLSERPAAVHPAIWRRATGEQVLHVSPWQAAGIAGQENAEGDALYEALCQEIYAKMQPYWHAWQPGDMVLWDNWRFIHAVSGHDPQAARRVHRIAIAGDYGLGRWENEPLASKPAGATR